MHVALLYGGRSSEHNVSIKSAQNIYTILKKLGHAVLPIGISLSGTFHLQEDKPIQETIDQRQNVTVLPGLGFSCNNNLLPIEVAFPVTHGMGGEDGNLQGLCFLAQIPLCGCDTVSSALGMHKELAQQLFASAGIPTVPTLSLNANAIAWLKEVEGASLPAFLGEHFFCSTCTTRIEIALPRILKQLGPSLLVKPENSGSSVGVTALKTPTGETLLSAIAYAAKFSECVLLQRLIEPMVEIECAVLTTQDKGLLVAGPGLVIDPAKQNAGFLTYAHKYGQIDTAHMQIPSTLDGETEKTIRDYAKKAFLSIKGDGYARVDFFFSDGLLYINEINTLPGMTATSHYPVLMQSCGYSLEQVVQTLLDHTILRAQEEKGRTYVPPGI
ncbi:ATP-grasp enzyme, D-alanine-D-alanine ligase [Sphaerochaeta pleomorpha str. Grapes]|uniref:D-alanine--D-alanine ligase n=1 Tax=Sphaerochaeta pleomorpha (strain ATCC BAA-1885 / DSM 22778 / Grapes) TaxID=158190 RepID=G8QQM9_SPHPG|nr:D-alanine--D-alanine ligase [Sphaerochaeta pleomorpha]AEV30959.1 ATP-grasp enzyme, D-alanine-D-alanine ligase [Sphaerochaeta pleomorpha str. Grapes]